MIYFHLSGRLGNQLFIWASALNLEGKKREQVRFCHDKLPKEIHGSFTDLKIFLNFLGWEDAISERKFQYRILRLYDGTKAKSSQLGRLMRSIFKLELQEGPYDYFEFKNQSKWIYRGYFQNIDSMQKVLPLALELIEKFCSKVFQESSIFSNNSILHGDYQVIHLRRGDYVGSPFGVLQYSYYKKLLRKDLPLVICSDDSSEASNYQEFFKTPHIFTPLNSSPWEALTIISLGKSVLSSNSTLSWWGAAISNKNGNEVFLPEPWLKSLAVPSENFLLSRMTKSNSEFEINVV